MASSLILSNSQSSLMSTFSSSPPRTWRYHVFTSFHGPDVRKTFLSHLRKQFIFNGIMMFDDQGIERGQTIAPSLTKAIRESRISLVVLSNKYASSSWCLDELLEIMDYKKVMGQIVMTVFYGVEPHDVRKQTGEFGNAFKETCEGKTEEEKRRWSQALNVVANIAGEHFRNWDNEAKMVEKIARDVSHKLNATPSRDFDGMVGLEAHLREMESLLDLDYDGVRMVAIYGPAGIGKTTIARALQSLISNRFQLSCIVENLRGRYHSGLDEYGLKLHLQEHLLSKILNQDGTMICHLGAVKERLCDLKVLIILDDVNDVKQLEALANETTWFGPGSRIIVTTENKELLQQHGINNTYHVEFPSDEEALKIFCKYAFRKISPLHGFEELAKGVTKLCGNLPLGLRVVGSCLQWGNQDEWEYMICKLKSNIDRDIEDVLRVGYESLNENEQTIFLHIAVFFNYEDVDLVKSMLGDNDLDIKYGLKLLINRSLIYISRDGEIVVHKLLQQVCRQAIHRQEPWRRRVLIDAQEICDVLENDKGSVAVSGISFDITGINEVIISNRALRRMRNLRFLHVYKSIYDEDDRVHIPMEMEFPPHIRLLHWNAYPSKSLPARFCAQNLVELRMRDSQLEKLWEGTQPLTNLKKMDLSKSYNLKELPDLSNAINLKRLDLDFCEALVELPSSIGNLHKLEYLMMESCKSLEVIPTHINLASLIWIQMNGCSRLRTFPVFSTNIQTLDLTGAAVEEMPASIKHWSRLECIRTMGCVNLKTLTHFPRSVKWLYLQNTDIVKIPDCIKDLCELDHLYLDCCRKLESLPELPSSLTYLWTENCNSLERVTSPFNTPDAELIFTNCFKLSGEARRLIIRRSYLYRFTCLPGSVMPSEFNHRAKGNSLTIPLSSPSSSKFKACVIISPNLRQHTRELITITLRYNNENTVSFDLRAYVSAFRTEHMWIFHGDTPTVGSEALFEFHIRLESYDLPESCGLDIIECGVRILTNESERSNEDYDDSSYNFELNEVLKDSKDGVISSDSALENVEEKTNHMTGCWSWLFFYFSPSNIMKNIGSLCWGNNIRI